MLKHIIKPIIEYTYPIFLLFRSVNFLQFDIFAFISLKSFTITNYTAAVYIDTHCLFEAHLTANIHEKTFVVTKQSTKLAKLFHCERKAIYGIP